MPLITDPITVPAYIVLAGWFLAVSTVGTLLTLFFRGSLMSRRNHDEQTTYLRESRDEWRSSSQEQASVIRDLTSRAVVLPTRETAAVVAAQKILTGAD